MAEKGTPGMPELRVWDPFMCVTHLFPEAVSDRGKEGGDCASCVSLARHYVEGRGNPTCPDPASSRKSLAYTRQIRRLFLCTKSWPSAGNNKLQRSQDAPETIDFEVRGCCGLFHCETVGLLAASEPETLQHI